MSSRPATRIRPRPATADREQLTASFEQSGGLTVGLEEEVMLLDPESLDLAADAARVLERLGDRTRFRPELPACQLEIVTGAHERLADAIDELARGRKEVQRASEGLRVAAIPVHPFAATEGELSSEERYVNLGRDFGAVARRQLVASLHVHVAVGGAERTLAVYNALRSHLPEIAALSASGPFHGGADTGLASIRPKIADLLPHQGIPPALGDWDEYAAALGWSAASARAPRPDRWWYECRPHPAFGTVEVRVADAQAELADTAAIAALIQALVARLAADHADGEELPLIPTDRIEENRRSAIRHGVEGTMRDLETGKTGPTRERLSRLLEDLAEVGASLGLANELERAHGLIVANGAIRQRQIAAAMNGDLVALTRTLSDLFDPGGGLPAGRSG